MLRKDGRTEGRTDGRTDGRNFVGEGYNKDKQNIDLTCKSWWRAQQPNLFRMHP